jgi:hypothetical protein
MWLPEPIYEKIPHFWFLAGLVFIFTGLYLGFQFAATIWYVALGVICCACGIWIFAMRVRYRAKRDRTDTSMGVEE